MGAMVGEREGVEIVTVNTRPSSDTQNVIHGEAPPWSS